MAVYRRVVETAAAPLSASDRVPMENASAPIVFGMAPEL